MSDANEYFTCLICQEVPDPKLAIQCEGCRTVFCDRCIIEWSKKGGSCPNCREENDYVEADKAIQRVLGETQVECPYECGALTTKSELRDHCRMCNKKDDRFDFTAEHTARTPLKKPERRPQNIAQASGGGAASTSQGPSQDQCESDGLNTAAVIGVAIGSALVGLVGGLIGAAVVNSSKKKRGN